MFVIDPVVKDADYTVSRVLAKAFPAEVQEIFRQFDLTSEFWRSDAPADAPQK